MTKKLDWMPGTIDDSKRAAALHAIKERDDVIYEFQDTEHTITLAEANELLPKLIADTMQELDNFKTSFNRRLDYLQKALTEVIEAASQR